jgi:hypothetical protein
MTDTVEQLEARLRDRCHGCAREVDRNCCNCGEAPGGCDNHHFSPAGCICGYANKLVDGLVELRNDALAIIDAKTASIAALKAENERLRGVMEDVEASAQEKAADWLDIAADTIDPAGVFRHLKQQAAILRESVREHRDAARLRDESREP